MNTKEDGWTFGIITKGERNDNIARFIKSVNNQNIPNYEIIIVGDSEPLFEEGELIKHIPFTKHDEKGWITRKKNIICEKAKYNNIFVGHDDIELDDEWYKDMKKFGNDWNVLNFTYLNENGERNYWEYNTHAGQPYISGSFIALKKRVFELCKWDETLFWNQREDVMFSIKLLVLGIGWKVTPAKVRMIGQNLRILSENERKCIG